MNLSSKIFLSIGILYLVTNCNHEKKLAFSINNEELVSLFLNDSSVNGFIDYWSLILNENDTLSLNDNNVFINKYSNIDSTLFFFIEKNDSYTLTVNTLEFPQEKLFFNTLKELYDYIDIKNIDVYNKHFGHLDIIYGGQFTDDDFLIYYMKGRNNDGSYFYTFSVGDNYNI